MVDEILMKLNAFTIEYSNFDDYKKKLMLFDRAERKFLLPLLLKFSFFIHDFQLNWKIRYKIKFW